jgi:hypothetical protein
VIFALVLLVELLVPLLICAALMRRGLLVDPTKRFYKIFSLFFRFYEQGEWTMLWEFVGIAVKRIPLLCIVVFISDPQSRLASCAIFTTLHVLLQLLFRPFRDPLDNWLEAFSLFSLTLLVFVLFSSNLDQEPSPEQTRIQFVFFLAVGFVLLLFVVTANLHKLDGCKTPNEHVQAIRDRFFPGSKQQQAIELASPTAGSQPSGLQHTLSEPSDIRTETRSEAMQSESSELADRRISLPPITVSQPGSPISIAHHVSRRNLQAAVGSQHDFAAETP